MAVPWSEWVLYVSPTSAYIGRTCMECTECTELVEMDSRGGCSGQPNSLLAVFPLQVSRALVESRLRWERFQKKGEVPG